MLGNAIAKLESSDNFIRSYYFESNPEYSQFNIISNYLSGNESNYSHPNIQTAVIRESTMKLLLIADGELF